MIAYNKAHVYPHTDLLTMHDMAKMRLAGHVAGMHFSVALMISWLLWFNRALNIIGKARCMTAATSLFAEFVIIQDTLTNHFQPLPY